MLLMYMDALAGGNIPDAQGGIVSTRGDEPTVLDECYRQDLADVARQGFRA